MTIINLRDFYPWYRHDEFIEASDVVAAELQADKRYHKAHTRRVKRNKVYSLDAGDGIETAAIVCVDPPPWEIMEMTERRCRLCRTLNSLPELQGRRIEARYVFGRTLKEIAENERVSKEAVRKTIKKGLAAMREYFAESTQKNVQN